MRLDQSATQQLSLDHEYVAMKLVCDIYPILDQLTTQFKPPCPSPGHHGKWRFPLSARLIPWRLVSKYGRHSFTSIPNLHELKFGHPQGRAGGSGKHIIDPLLIAEGLEQPRSENERSQRQPPPVPAAGLEEM